MGYDGRYSWTSAKDVKESLVKEWKESDNYLLIDRVTHGGRHLWVGLVGKDGVGVVVLHLIEKHGGCWMQKVMDETMHPYYYDCPLSVLDAVGPASNESAEKWREGVLSYHEKLNQTFEEGEKIKIYGKDYTVVSQIKKGTYGVVNDQGKRFKATTKNMDKHE